MHSLDNSSGNTTREQFWRQHVNDWRDSGLSKRQYCQQYDLVYHQMIYWCSKSGAPDEVVNTGAGGFAQAALSNRVASHSPSLSIELPNGVTVNNLNPQTIAFLLAAITVNSGYALRPDPLLTQVYLYRDAVDFRNYADFSVMRSWARI